MSLQYPQGPQYTVQAPTHAPSASCIIKAQVPEEGPIVLGNYSVEKNSIKSRGFLLFTKVIQ